METHRKGSEFTERPFWGKHWLCSGVKGDANFSPHVLKITFDREHIFMYYSCILKEGNGNIAAAATASKSLQSCPTLCDPTDGSPPGSPVPGILLSGKSKIKLSDGGFPGGSLAKTPEAEGPRSGN